MAATKKAPSALAYWSCGVMAALVWLALFYCTRHASYAWDDFTVLGPLFGEGLVASLRRTVRPIEYFGAWLSMEARSPIWLWITFAAYVGTALQTLTLLSRVGLVRSEVVSWQILLCASTPVAALAYFQIDLVSQALSNLSCTLLVLNTLSLLKETESGRVKTSAWSLLLVAVLCIASKETSYGMVAMAILLGLRRHGRSVLLPLCVALVLLVLVVLRSLTINDLDSGEHYGLKPFWMWPLNLAFLIIVAIAPIPTSTTLTMSASAAPLLTAQVAVGAATAAALAWLVLRGTMSAMRDTSWHTVLGWAIRPWENQLVVVALFAAASGAPALFFHVSEMYASQAVPCLIVLVVAAVTAGTSRGAGVVLSLCAVCWIAASAVNLAFYSLITGYDPGSATLGSAERRVFADVEAAVAHRRVQYSVYGWTTEMQPVDNGECKIDRRFPRVCLPKDISRGFPRLQSAAIAVDKPD